MPKRYIRMVQKPGLASPELNTEAEVTLQSRGESRKLAAKVEAGGRLQQLKAGATPGKFVPQGAETAVNIETLPQNTLAAMFDKGRVHAEQGLIYTEVMGSVDNLELAPHKLYENTYDEIMSTLVNMWRVMNIPGIIDDPRSKIGEYKTLVQDLLVQMQTMGKAKYDAAKAKYQAVYKAQYKIEMAKNPKPTPRKAADAAAKKAMSDANKMAPGFRNFHATIWANRKKINATVFSIKMTPTAGGPATDDVPLSIYNAGLMLERAVAAGKDVVAAHKANVTELQANLPKGAVGGSLATNPVLKQGPTEYAFTPDEPLVVLSLNAEATKTANSRYKSVQNHEVSKEGYKEMTKTTVVPDTYGAQRAAIRSSGILVLESALNEPIPGKTSDISNKPTSWKSTSTVEVAVSGLRFRKAANNPAKHRSLKKGEKLTFVFAAGASAPTKTTVSGIDFYEVQDASGTKGFVAFKSGSKQYFTVKDVTSAAITDY